MIRNYSFLTSQRVEIMFIIGNIRRKANSYESLKGGEAKKN